MKALSLFSFLLMVLTVVSSQNETDKTIGLEIGYDDGDTYYYYNINRHPNTTTIKKKPPPTPHKKQQNNTTLAVRQPKKLRGHHHSDIRNHWTYADDNDTMMNHRRCWLYRDPTLCQTAGCCWFQEQQQCHGCHHDK
jgi:hypothetical protein